MASEDIAIVTDSRLHSWFPRAQNCFCKGGGGAGGEGGGYEKGLIFLSLDSFEPLTLISLPPLRSLSTLLRIKDPKMLSRELLVVIEQCKFLFKRALHCHL